MYFTLLKKLAYASFFLPFFLLCQNLETKSYILDNRDALLVPKTIAFVEQLSNELFTKTGFSLYIAVIDKIPSEFAQSDAKLARNQYKSSITQNLTQPYSIIFFFKNDQKIDILSSEPHTFFNEDKVFFEYMVPLLPKQKDEFLSSQRVSAILLNGYVEAADLIAEHFNQQLEHNFPKDETGGREFVRFSMYAMLFVMFGIIGFIYVTRKK